MNGGGKYYYVIFFLNGKIIWKGECFAFRNFDLADAMKVSEREDFLFSSYDADFLREQTGDEM